MHLIWALTAFVTLAPAVQGIFVEDSEERESVLTAEVASKASVAVHARPDIKLATTAHGSSANVSSLQDGSSSSDLPSSQQTLSAISFIWLSKHPFIFPVLELAQQVSLGMSLKVNSTRTFGVSDKDKDKWDQDVRVWLLGYLVSLAVLLMLFMWLTGHMVVEVPAENDEFMRTLKGKPCWNLCVLMACVLTSLFIFWLTVSTCSMTNQTILLKPITRVTIANTTVVTTKTVIYNPGQRAFLSAHGISLSAFAAALLLSSWRYSDQTQITTALLAQYAVRGGSFALVIAVSFVGGGLMLLGSVGISTVATYMALVGYSEEYAKMIAVTCGTCLLPGMYHVAANSCICSCLCRTLVETPRGLMLAGLAAGFGFMTVENGLYVMASATVPSTTIVTTDDNTGKIISTEEMTAESTLILTIATVAIRIVFNIHPWLTGLCSARIGKVAFKEERGTACLETCTVVSAINPSSIIHGVYDFLVTVLPGGLALICVPIIWFGSKWSFSREWQRADEADNEGESRASTG
jgi:RsiW-degrading membrane proteinase PrsW (M82 family)